MKKILVAVRDSKLEAFMNPFVVETVPVAIRIFGDAVNDSKTALFQHPEDFDLYRIGDVDMTSGLVTPCSPIVHLAAAKELIYHE